MKIVAFTNTKGGTGKSTLAANTAVAAHQDGERVVALDLDPQGSLMTWAAVREADHPPVDSVDATRLARLPEILSALGGQGFSLAILDCPGTFTTATNRMVTCADLNILPLSPSPLDQEPTANSVRAIRKLGRPFALVLNKVSPNLDSARNVEAVAALQETGHFAPSILVNRVSYQDAWGRGLSVLEHEPRGRAADEIRRFWCWLKSAI